MWRSTDKSAITALLVAAMILLVTSANSATADSGLLTGSLGRWLDAQAVPELAETLSKHPKFSGEAVQIVALQDGRPVDTPSRLHQAIEAHLTQRLLQYPGVTLTWREPLQTCGVPRQPIYLLGIEFEPPAGTAQSLSIGMIDVADSVWVSGISLNWRGRLSSAEALALRSPIPGQARGTIDSPLPPHATSQISQLLQRNVRCTLPDGLDGPVYIDSAPGSELSRLRSQLQRDLNLAALAAVTTDPADASWRIMVSANPIGPSTREIVLTLTDANGDANQHLASVFVTDENGNSPLPADARIATATAPAAVPVTTRATTLLTPMQLNPYASGGACESHRSDPGPCVEVTFELTREAYLFVLSTRDRELQASSCATSVRTAEAGKRRLRMRVAPSATGGTADAGVYAIAAVDRKLARAIARHIGKAPGACSKHGRAGTDQWLTQFDALLQQYPGGYEWQALHLANQGNELVEI